MASRVGGKRMGGLAVGWLSTLVGCFAITGWVLFRVAGEAGSVRMLVWFVAAAVVHDLVLFPSYALADRVLNRLVRVLPGDRIQRPVLVNHVRVPVLASGLLLLVFLPGILGLGGGTYQAATGRPPGSDWGRWLLISATIFAVSAVWLVVRLVRADGRR
nr:hypothetical protein [Micromonospora sp. DSM 115978]